MESIEEQGLGNLRLGPHASMAFGLVLTAALATLAMHIASMSLASAHGISALTLAIIVGAIAGNTVFPGIAPIASSGVDFAKGRLLRLGVVLYGFHVSFQEVSRVGLGGVVIAATVVCGTFVLSVLIGRRLFKIDRETAMLIGAGSAICGAAAVMATEPIVRAQAHKVSIAVATVVVFGTLGMFVYPLLYPHLGMSEHAYGIYVGSVVHEVAQVIVAGDSVSTSAANAAVIEKMLRVMLLAPFLLMLSIRSRPARAFGDEKCRVGITVPWFALLFIAAVGVNSVDVMPAAWVIIVRKLDAAVLCMAMAALGLRTHVGAIRQSGMKPLLLAATLFLILMAGGWVLAVAFSAMHWI